MGISTVIFEICLLWGQILSTGISSHLFIVMNCASANLSPGGLDEFVHGCVTVRLKEALC